MYRAFSSCDPKSRVGVQLVNRGSMQLSLSYAENLTIEAKTRYREKIGVIGGLDPLEVAQESHARRFPLMEASGLVAYLVL